MEVLSLSNSNSSNVHQQEEQIETCFHCGYQGKINKEYFGSCADCFWDHEEQFRKWRGAFNYYHEHEGKSEEEADTLARQDLEHWYLRFLEIKDFIYSLISEGMTIEDAKDFVSKNEIEFRTNFSTPCYEGDNKNMGEKEA